jgi:hypothetical protein
MAKNRGRGRRGRGRLGGGQGPGDRIRRAANAEAGAEFNPQIRAGREEIKGSRRRQGDLGSWYAQLAADYGKAQKTGAAALQSVEDTTSQQLAEAGDQSAAEQASLSAEDAKLAGITHTPTDTAGLAKIAQAGTAAQRAQVALAMPTAATQANFVASLGSDKAAARLQGISSRQEEAARRSKLRSDVAALGREKRAAATADATKLRESERNYAIEQAKLLLAQREANTQAQSAKAALAQDAIANRQAQERIGIERSNAAISAKNARTSARSQRATANHYRYENKGGLSASERRTQGEHLRNASVEAANLYKAAKKPPKSAADWAAFSHLVAEQSEISPTDAAKAVAKLRAALRAAGRRGYDKRVRRGEVAGPPTPR